MDKLYFGTGMTMGFAMTLIAIMVYAITHLPEPKHPSWYGTYYSATDALEDGWYEKN